MFSNGEGVVAPKKRLKKSLSVLLDSPPAADVPERKFDAQSVAEIIERSELSLEGDGRAEKYDKKERSVVRTVTLSASLYRAMERVSAEVGTAYSKQINLALKYWLSAKFPDFYED